jgi:hypothetical protein
MWSLSTNAFLQAGHKEWLLLDKYLFDFRGDTCNKIGVSFQAFKFGQDTKCRRKRGRSGHQTLFPTALTESSTCSCLDAQPAHFLEEARVSTTVVDCSLTVAVYSIFCSFRAIESAIANHPISWTFMAIFLALSCMANIENQVN